jgi:ubiquinone/menaquinone biosynthesis C-methylase UbiE
MTKWKGCKIMNEKECNPKQRNRLAKKVEFLEDPKRRGDVLPKELLQMMPIKKADTILDLGAGTGYFTIPLAKRNVQGGIYALDIDMDMIEIVNAKAQKENLHNVKTLKAGIEDIPLPERSVDLVLASLVLHEVNPLSNALQQIKRVLKSNGYVVCIEYEKQENAKDHHPRVSSATMEQEMKMVGFEVTKILYPTDEIYMIFAKKQ